MPVSTLNIFGDFLTDKTKKLTTMTRFLQEFGYAAFYNINDRVLAKSWVCSHIKV
jgi:hypothetical protein